MEAGECMVCDSVHYEIGSGRVYICVKDNGMFVKPRILK